MSTGKKQDRCKERGETGFHRYYQMLHGDRWEPLRTALAGAAVHAAWKLPGCPPYYLDPASVTVAYLLPLGTRNLDLCAAPGGKSLILAGRMAHSAGVTTLVANERSRARRARLQRVLDEHLPRELRDRIVITGHDASRWGLHEPETYDAILADVPCSSERHVLAVPDELARWSTGRIRRLAVQQFAILAAAIDSLRPGGHVLYSTCALMREENDAVVERALERRGDKVELLSLEPEMVAEIPAGIPACDPAGIEFTPYGMQILPDKCAGAGPMYCSLLRRRHDREPSDGSVLTTPTRRLSGEKNVR